MTKAAYLIEEMTGCLFKYCKSGAFICPDRADYLAVNMHKKADFEAKTYQISFDVYIQRIECSVDLEDLIKLRQEVDKAYELLNKLETYMLTPEEMKEFDDYIFVLDQQR